MSRECDAIALHLVGRRCPPDAAERYAAAVRDLNLTLAPAERRVWDACIRWRPLLYCLDAGTSFWHRNGGVRRRLLVMFALLEATPAISDKFLFATQSTAGQARLAGQVVLAGIAMVLGTPLGLLCRALTPRARD